MSYKSSYTGAQIDDTVGKVQSGALRPNNVAITGGSINGTPVGGSTPAAGSFTSVVSSSFTSISGTISDLSTSFVDFIASEALHLTCIVKMRSAQSPNPTYTFMVASNVYNGDTPQIRVTALAGCTAGTSGNNGTITIAAGDANTYTFTRDGGTGRLRIKSSGATSGNTTYTATILV